MRRRARTDANHADIVQALRSVGWTVIDTSRMGEGFPDALAARAGQLRLVEIKDGSKPPSKRALTKDEAQLHEILRLAGAPVVIISNVDEALSL